MNPLEGLLDDLEAQRDFFGARVPPYARILELLPDVLPWERLEKAWTGRSFGAWYERPLLILAALREEALAQGRAHPLFEAVGGDGTVDKGGDPRGDSAPVSNGDATPVATPDPDGVTRAALQAALAPDRRVWKTLRERHVQTNETSRAVAWLWPAHLLVAANSGISLQLFDIGASAGLNLVADALPRIWSRSDGTSLPTEPLPRIGIRRGFDLRPLDPDAEESARWLRACVWPGQQHRARRLERALAAWRASDPRPDLVRAHAVDVPGRLPTVGENSERILAVQCIMRDYLSAEERARYETGMHDWIASGRPGTHLWIELEVTEGAREGGPPAAITAHWSGGSVRLATCEPHPRVLDVDDRAVRELQRGLS